MAEQLLRTVLVNEAFGIFDAGDKIDSYFEDTTDDTIVVRLNGSVITSGSTLLQDNSFNDELSLIDVIGPNLAATGSGWGSIVTNFTTIIDGFELTFPPVGNFPYVNIKKTQVITPPDDDDPEDDPIDPNDISIKITSITPDDGTGNGEVIVEASGKNGPFTYFDSSPLLNPFITPNAGQASGTFSDLITGTYTFYARDTSFYLAEISVYVPLNETPEVINYGTRWRHQYNDITLNKSYRLDIQQRDFTGTITQVKGGPNPFDLSFRAEGNDVYQIGVLPATGTVNLMSETLNEFIDIAKGDELEFLVVFYEEVDSLYQEVWRGLVTPQTYTDVLYHEPYQVSFTANDRLADLNKIDFSYGDVTNFFSTATQLVKGDLSLLTMINLALSKLNMGFGYRIACNIFETNQTQTDTTPLEQTFINADTFNSKDGRPSSCLKVVQDLLKPFNAFLFAWEGYWYIIRSKELADETINYVEYDSTISFVQNGSYNPRIQFRGATNENRARWINGAQSRIFTPSYKRVNININRNLLNDDNSLIEPFNVKSLTKPVFGVPSVHKQFNIFSQDAKYLRDSTINTVGVSLQGDRQSNTYLQNSGTIEYGNTDRFVLAFGFNVSAFFQGFFSDSPLGVARPETPYPPYAQVKWSFRLGDLWLASTGDWLEDKVINYIFVDQFEENVEFDFRFAFPEFDGVQIDDYEFRVYACDLGEALQVYSSSDDPDEDGLTQADRDLIAFVSSLTTVGQPDGIRLSLVSNDVHRYYELRSDVRNDDGLSIIRPSDYSGSSNTRNWVQVATAKLPTNEEQAPGIVAVPFYTRTEFNQINILFLPNGIEEIDEVKVLSGLAFGSNLNELDLELNVADIDQSINNSEVLFTNYLKLSDGTPTQTWQEVGGTLTKKIQTHLLDYVLPLAKVSRSKVSSSFRVDGLNWTPKNVLVDVNDSNRLYLPIGIQTDFKNQQYSGELLEVASDVVITTSAFTNGFKQDAVT